MRRLAERAPDGGYPQHFGDAELAAAAVRRAGAPPSRARNAAGRFLSAARTDRAWRGQFRAVSPAFRGMARRQPCRVARGLRRQRRLCRRRRPRSRRGDARRSRSRHLLRVRAGRRDRRGGAGAACDRRGRDRGRYAPALSTCAGLWGFILGDTVRFVSRDPPRLLVTGRLSYTLSAFGEHLTGEEIEAAVTEAAAAIGAELRDFAVGALFPQAPGELGGHLYRRRIRAPRRRRSRGAPSPTRSTRA